MGRAPDRDMPGLRRGLGLVRGGICSRHSPVSWLWIDVFRRAREVAGDPPGKVLRVTR